MFLSVCLSDAKNVLGYGVILQWQSGEQCRPSGEQCRPSGEQVSSAGHQVSSAGHQVSSAGHQVSSVHDSSGDGVQALGVCCHVQ